MKFTASSRSNPFSQLACPDCGAHTLEDAEKDSPPVFGIASHSLDDDDPGIFVADSPPIKLRCKSCNAGFWINLARKRYLKTGIIEYSARDLPDDTPLEQLMLPHSSASNALIADETKRCAELQRLMEGRNAGRQHTLFRRLREEPWPESKRRAWLRAAIIAEDLPLIEALVATHVPLKGMFGLAMEQRRFEAALWLLDHGADLYDDVLLIVKLRGHPDSAGPDLRLTTPLKIAMYERHLPLIEKLVAKGSSCYGTALLAAAMFTPQRHFSVETLRLLITQDRDTEGALFYAVNRRKEEVLRWLLDAGLDVKASLEGSYAGYRLSHYSPPGTTNSDKLLSNWLQRTSKAVRDMLTPYRQGIKITIPETKMPEQNIKTSSDEIGKTLHKQTPVSSVTKKASLLRFAAEATDAQGVLIRMGFAAETEEAALQMIQNTGYRPLRVYRL